MILKFVLYKILQSNINGGMLSAMFLLLYFILKIFNYIINQSIQKLKICASKIFKNSKTYKY